MLDLGEANSLSDLLTAAHDADNHFGEQVWFRGHAQTGWQLVPSAHRRHSVLESQFAHHFRLRAPSLTTDCPGHKDYAKWLPLMQHYGLPTRLLDWTESLLVAAFFAVPPKATSPFSEIWLLAPGALNQQSIGRVIPFLVDDRITPLITAAFSGKTSPEDQKSVAVFAPRTDRRMAAQLGNYTIHGVRNPLETHPASSQFLARVLIPATALNKIRADILISGTRRSLLFPDLSNLAMEIAEIEAIGPTDNNLESPHEEQPRL